MIRQQQHFLVPFRSTCSMCNRNLNVSDAIQKQLRLYCGDGSVVTATTISLHCYHDLTSSTRTINQDPVDIFSNFTRINKCNVYTHDSLHYGDYVYLGGDIAVERVIINKYTAQIIQNDFSMMGFAASLNQEAINLGHPQMAAVDRRLLGNIIHAYLIIQFDLSMGNISVSTPCKLSDFNEWAWNQFPRLLSSFIYLWMNHRTLIGSCGIHCSKCLVIDGHQKSRRRICAFKDVKVQTEEMNDLVIGCCKTPVRYSRYCETHNDLSSAITRNRRRSSTKRKKQIKRFFHLVSQNSSRRADRLNATSCRTLKARSDSYVNRCTRSFGIIALVSNCRIITSFSELYRSETLREIINLFAVSIRVAGKLASTCVYDDGCHLVRYIKNHIGREINKTPAMILLDSTPISIDRSHFRNHVGTFCRTTMNPDKNPLLKDVNTEAAEQTFSWLKHYAPIISNMNHLRAPLFMLILFHLKNLSRVKRSPSFVIDIIASVPKVEDYSYPYENLRHTAVDLILSS
ncbi:unnamed protein product [Adineta ricciae]|uniref:Uncharacterized protein n=1 Tax=Adineta ricciae TaxID=249248 RepID=A0A814HXJ8_ADIRI|nr:unnamed protein product [Adineta ricciae]